MRITFIGTGSIIPTPKKGNAPFRSYSAVYVESEKDTFLFDIGPGTLTKLQQNGIDTRIKPDKVLISHYHIDHCADIVSLVKGRAFHPKNPEVGGKPIQIYGPYGLTSFSQNLFHDVKKWSYMSNYISSYKLVELSEVEYGVIEKTARWKLSCIPVRHYDGVAYRLDIGSASFVYSGDMGYDERLAKLGKNADIVAIECSFPDKKTLRGMHLCPEDVGKLAKIGKFKHTILTHLYPQCEGQESEMIKTVESISNAKTTIAYDGYSITLTR